VEHLPVGAGQGASAFVKEVNLGQVMSFSCFFGRIRTDVSGGDIGIIRKPENGHSYGTMK
jgi:hypothetical protein